MNKKLLILIFAILFISGCSQSGSPPVPVEPVGKESIVLEPYEACGDLHITRLQVPSLWVLEVINNGILYTEKTTGTQLAITFEDYNPTLNSVNYAVAENVANNSGGRLIQFEKLSGNSFISKSALTNSNNGLNFKWEYAVWNLKYSYHIVLYVEDVHETLFTESYREICDSLVLNENPSFAKDFACYYNANLGLSIEYPFYWVFNQNESGFYIENKDTKSGITVDIILQNIDLQSMTELSYLEMMRGTIPTIALTSFYNSGSTISAELFFNNEGKKYVVRNLIIRERNCILNFTYTGAADFVQQETDVFDKVIKSKKI